MITVSVCIFFWAGGKTPSNGTRMSLRPSRGSTTLYASGDSEDEDDEDSKKPKRQTGVIQQATAAAIAAETQLKRLSRMDNDVEEEDGFDPLHSNVTIEEINSE